MLEQLAVQENVPETQFLNSPIGHPPGPVQKLARHGAGTAGQGNVNSLFGVVFAGLVGLGGLAGPSAAPQLRGLAGFRRTASKTAYKDPIQDPKDLGKL